MGRSILRIGWLAVALLSLTARNAEATCLDPVSCCIAAGGDPISCLCPVQGTCNATQFTLDLDQASPFGGIAIAGTMATIDFLINNVVVYSDEKVYLIAVSQGG